ncbi:hypothetical protein WA158_007233 [Blastocystis sp. Blastoise]
MYTSSRVYPTYEETFQSSKAPISSSLGNTYPSLSSQRYKDPVLSASAPTSEAWFPLKQTTTYSTNNQSSAIAPIPGNPNQTIQREMGDRVATRNQYYKSTVDLDTINSIATRKYGVNSDFRLGSTSNIFTGLDDHGLSLTQYVQKSKSFQPSNQSSVANGIINVSDTDDDDYITFLKKKKLINSPVPSSKKPKEKKQYIPSNTYRNDTISKIPNKINYNIQSDEEIDDIHETISDPYSDSHINPDLKEIYQLLDSCIEKSDTICNSISNLKLNV